MVLRNSSRPLFALVAWLGAAPLAAQAPAATAPLRLSFADAVSMAVGKTPVVELATLRATEADARVRQARAALLPSLSGSGAWLNRSFNSRSIGISFPGVPELIGPFNNYDARLNAAQALFDWSSVRSEEHTSELQSLAYLVCRLLLEKKKKKIYMLGITN